MVDEFTHQMCLCLYNRKMSLHLGPEIVRAVTEKDSSLYHKTTVKGEEVLIDRTKENLFLKTYWSDLTGHLKWTLYCKGLFFSFQVTTDERIRNVYVGNEQYTHRTRSSRDETEANNSLHDLLGDVDLLVLRLGFLGYRNQAMAGALLEALRIREVSLKPTWIIEEPNSIFAPGHYSYSPELWDYITSRYTIVNMVTDTSRQEPQRGTEGSSLTEAPGMSFDEEPAQVRVPAPILRSASPSTGTSAPRKPVTRTPVSSDTGARKESKTMSGCPELDGKPSWSKSGNTYKRKGGEVL